MLYIHGAGHYHPTNVIDNAFLESLDIGTTDQWILERVGIQKRRIQWQLVRGCGIRIPDVQPDEIAALLLHVRTKLLEDRPGDVLRSFGKSWKPGHRRPRSVSKPSRGWFGP